jgi:OmpA-OmpF porin, OOP family
VRHFAPLRIIAGLLLIPVISAGSGYADPTYKADDVVNFFVKSRSICFGTTADCPAPPSHTGTQFNLSVKFEFDSDKLTKAAEENLDQFAEALHDSHLRGQKFEIDGHTDATGAEQYNLGLSERRAESVVAYLIRKGIGPADLMAKGFGKSRPRVADPFSPDNRRVETRIMERP